MSFLKMRWLFNKRTAWTLLWVVLLVLVAGLVNLAGVRIAGDIEGWTAWLKDHAAIFMVWRIALYAGVVCGWVWMRRRVLSREEAQEKAQEKKQEGGSKQSAMRLIRIEVAAVAALLVLELSNRMA